jgi:mannose-binding lectin
MIISAQTNGGFSTSNNSWTAIPGLVVTVPEITGEAVLFVLNVPNPYANGNNYPGGKFGIYFNGEMQGPFAAFTYSQQTPSSPGRVPTTLCVAAVLPAKGPTTVTAMWSALRNSTVHIDSPATLTMIL